MLLPPPCLSMKTPGHVPFGPMGPKVTLGTDDIRDLTLISQKVIPRPKGPSVIVGPPGNKNFGPMGTKATIGNRPSQTIEINASKFNGLIFFYNN